MAIATQLDGGVLWARIEREPVLNALDIPHLQALLDVLHRAGDDAGVRTLVITGSGRAFSVGADIKAMASMSEADFSVAAELYQTLCRAARALDIPVIAAINGFALGGGLEVALLAHIRVAARSAQLGLPDAALGFSPTGGLTWLLPRVVGSGRALHMAITAEMLSADEALAIGLVTAVHDDPEFEPATRQLAARLAAYPATGMKNIIRSFKAASTSSLSAALTLEAEYDAACYRSPETRQALEDFLESRRK